jgi:hypothetical protein
MMVDSDIRKKSIKEHAEKYQDQLKEEVKLEPFITSP